MLLTRRWRALPLPASRRGSPSALGEVLLDQGSAHKPLRLVGEDFRLAVKGVVSVRRTSNAPADRAHDRLPSLIDLTWLFRERSLDLCHPLVVAEYFTHVVAELSKTQCRFVVRFDRGKEIRCRAGGFSSRFPLRAEILAVVRQGFQSLSFRELGLLLGKARLVLADARARLGQ